jgi:hypothetical protein
MICFFDGLLLSQPSVEAVTRASWFSWRLWEPVGVMRVGAFGFQELGRRLLVGPSCAVHAREGKGDGVAVHGGACAWSGSGACVNHGHQRLNGTRQPPPPSPILASLASVPQSLKKRTRVRTQHQRRRMCFTATCARLVTNICGHHRLKKESTPPTKSLFTTLRSVQS